MGALFSGPPKPPKPPPPVAMPDFEDPAILEKARRRKLEAASRSGRASTMLTGGTDDYSGDRLGTR